jgi:glutamate carboxypeptidase
MSLNADILKKIESLRKDIYQSLYDVVEINSFTYNIDGVIETAEKLIEIGKKLGINLEKYYPDENSETFHLISGKELNSDFFGIVGHFDTVHPPEDGFLKIKEKDDKLIGPGVNDMKGGLIVALYSIYVLKTFGINIPIKIIFNCDEEIGSKTSRDFIMREFQGAKCVFVFEAGRPENNIVYERKGVIELKLKYIGKPSHAGESPEEGINSIVEMSDKILKLYDLNGRLEGLTVNPGIIKGGTARNVIPSWTETIFDIRFKKLSEKEDIFEMIEEIINDTLLKGIKADYELKSHRPPMELMKKTEKYIQLYQNVGTEIGMKIGLASSGGVSDANLMNGIAPVIDGLGPVGMYPHTQKEFIIKESLMDRIKIFTLFLQSINLQEV